MSEYNYDALDHLHDAVLVSLTFSPRPDGSRDGRLVATCDEECEYDEWAGKTVSLVFSDILLLDGVLLGHVCGQEFVNTISQGLLPCAEERVSALVREGVRMPRIRLTVALQSGSEVAVACDGVEVAVQENDLG
jgi:hypothetical protein